MRVAGVVRFTHIGHTASHSRDKVVVMLLTLAVSLSGPIVSAHRGLCRAVSEVKLAGVHWQAHLAVPAVAFLTRAPVPIWSQVGALSLRVADVLRTRIDGLAVPAVAFVIGKAFAF